MRKRSLLKGHSLYVFTLDSNFDLINLQGESMEQAPTELVREQLYRIASWEILSNNFSQNITP